MMATTFPGSTSTPSHWWRWATLAGLLAASLDIAYAAVTAYGRGATPVRMLHSIASGVLGRESYAGGIATAALGLGLHYTIVLAMAFAYFAAARRWEGVVRRPLRSAIVYGLVIWVVMERVVVPLSAAPFRMPMDPASATRSLAVHVFLVALPIAVLALIAHRQQLRVR